MKVVATLVAVRKNANLTNYVIFLFNLKEIFFAEIKFSGLISKSRFRLLLLFRNMNYFNDLAG